MVALDIAHMASFDSAALAKIQRRMHGELLTPQSDAYEVAWQIHSQRFSGRPALIARCLNIHDVALAIIFARERKLTIAATSHDPSERAVLFDLSQMRQITIDPLQQIAWVQSGATAEEVAQAVATYGLTGNTVLALEIVDLDGLVITASANEHAELFQAAHEGSEFGVVTATTYQLRLLDANHPSTSI